MELGDWSGAFRGGGDEGYSGNCVEGRGGRREEWGGGGGRGHGHGIIR